jgi:hypothetical protein
MLLGWSVSAAAGDLTFSAQVDKTSVKVGEPIQLTITLSGDIAGVELPAFEFPEGFAVAARSQSTNFSIRGGAAERSVSLIYILLPQQGGTFQLGPFYIEHNGTTLPTQPIDITVEKPAVPPSLKAAPGERFTL